MTVDPPANTNTPASEPDFEDDAAGLRRDDEGRLVVDLDGFEGPIDVLLILAREQKVDLARISILQLADQYLAFITEARKLHLEIAADYLVMAAWLAYLKSRLLLPEVVAGEEPSGEEMAAMLAFQLRRLEAMQEAGQTLMARPRLGYDMFARGEPESIATLARPVFDVSLYELLRAYGDHRASKEQGTLRIAATELYSMDDAMRRLQELVGHTPDWTTLFSFLPVDLRGGIVYRSALAATFTASLELARSGKLHLRQVEPFGPIYVRKASPQT